MDGERTRKQAELGGGGITAWDGMRYGNILGVERTGWWEPHEGIGRMDRGWWGGRGRSPVPV